MELRNVTIPELAAAIAAAPAALREELAKGPAPDWRCRLCRSFRAVGMLNEDDLDGPSKTVWQWHEDHEVLAARAFTETFVEGNPTDEEVDVVRKGLDARELDSVTYAFAGTLSYYRLCIAYLLAGWKPEPPRVEVEMKLEDLTDPLRNAQAAAYHLVNKKRWTS